MKKRNLIVLLILHFISLKGEIYAQADGIVIYQNCDFPRQKGKLEILKRDSLMILQTDSSNITVKKNLYLDQDQDLVFIRNKNFNEKPINFKCDSLASLLFVNGLLTPELLDKAGHLNKLYISNKGDTTLVMDSSSRHCNYDLYSIVIEKMPDKFLLSLIIYADVNNGTKSYCTYRSNYRLVLRSSVRLNLKDLNSFIMNAKTDCFLWLGFEM